MMDSGIGIAATTNSQPISASQEVVPSFEPGSGSSESNRSSQCSPMTQSVDDFTMVSSVRSMAASLTKSLYCQVVFHDVGEIYTTDSDIKCRYTLTSGVTAQPGDKVALFKIGWTSVSEYFTFVTAPRPSEDETTLTVTLKSEHLPRDESNLYQVCYVTSGNVIAGASTPFSFHVPTETELIAVEDPSDPGMIVFKSRVSKLQDDLRKKNVECEQYLLKQKVLEGNMVLLKNELDKADRELKICREKITEMFTEKQNLEIDNKVLDERVLQYKLESDAFDRLQCELDDMKASKAVIEAEYAELKTNHDNMMRLLEEDRKNYLSLKWENLDMTSSVNQHYVDIQEKNQLIESQASNIQCLQQDCERTTRALKEQVKMVESLSSQNETLNESMRKMAAKNNSIVMENIELSEEIKELERQNKLVNDEKLTLEKLVQENYEASDPMLVLEQNDLLQKELIHMEKENSLNVYEINQLKKQLHSQRESPSANGDQAGSIFENAASNIVPVIAHSSNPSNKSTFVSAPPSAPTEDGVETSAEDLTYAKLQDLRRSKANLGQELVIFRHRTGELEKQLVDLEQDNSCKKNRVGVLELELSSANKELSKLRKLLNEKATSSDSPQLDVLACSLPVIQKFNDQVTLLNHLQDKLDVQSAENSILKKKVENLLEMDSKKCCELEEMTKQCETLRKELDELRSTSQCELVVQLNAALDNCKHYRKEAEAKLRQETDGRLRAEQQMAALRAESVGKISVDCHRNMQDTISSLDVQLHNMTIFCVYMKKFIYSTFNGNRSKSIKCPFCSTEFPPGSERRFAGHFKDRHMN